MELNNIKSQVDNFTAKIKAVTEEKEKEVIAERDKLKTRVERDLEELCGYVTASGINNLKEITIKIDDGGFKLGFDFNNAKSDMYLHMRYFLANSNMPVGDGKDYAVPNVLMFYNNAIICYYDGLWNESINSSLIEQILNNWPTILESLYDRLIQGYKKDMDKSMKNAVGEYKKMIDRKARLSTINQTMAEF